jgi:hypothetical protein
MEYKAKIIAFVDILGWKDLVDNSEMGLWHPLPKLLALLDCFGTGKERDSFEKNGPQCCPAAAYGARNLDFRLTQVSDCAVVSAEISPAGVINLISHCWRGVYRFLEHGIMCRGYIKFGSVYHDERHIIGTGYQEAFAAERNVIAFKSEADERGTPFVQIDPAIVTYVEECNDSCVKTMYSRMTRSDGGVSALFPFQRIKHYLIPEQPGGIGLLSRQRQSNRNVREKIGRYKALIESLVDLSKPDAVRKSRHYLAALDRQLKVCDETDEAIDALDLRRQSPEGP